MSTKYCLGRAKAASPSVHEKSTFVSLYTSIYFFLFSFYLTFVFPLTLLPLPSVRDILLILFFLRLSIPFSSRTSNIASSFTRSLCFSSHFDLISHSVYSHYSTSSPHHDGEGKASYWAIMKGENVNLQMRCEGIQ